MLNSIKRDIIIKLHYEIDFEKLNKLMPIQTITPSDTVKEMVKKDIEERLQECVKQAKMKASSFIARKIDTGEVFGPFTNKTECKKFLGLKSNHISEVLEGKRKTQEGYVFQYCEGEDK